MNTTRRTRPQTSWPASWLAPILHALTVAAILVLPNTISAQTPTEALFQAVELNDFSAVEAAIDNGASLAEKNSAGMTPADVAVDLGHFRIAHLLLAKRTAAPPASRVTEKAKEALSSPRARVASPRRSPSSGRPELSKVISPVKPSPPPLVTQPKSPAPMQATPPQQAAPEPNIDTTPRPDDEMASSTPTEDVAAASPETPSADEGGLLDGLWGGIKNIATLGGLLGGEEQTSAKDATGDTGTYVARDPSKFSPADRFAAGENAAGGVTQRGSSAGRMVDRLTGIVGGNTAAENEFGLPTEPVLPPTTSIDGNTDLADLAPPVMPLEGLSELETALPPGVVTIPDDPLEIPGVATDTTLPPLADPQFGDGIAVEIPGLVQPVDPGQISEGLPLVDEIEVPGLPDELNIPGLAAPAEEVPGIIAPAGDDLAGQIPGLPPGLEPLPGSSTGVLRRPGGLITPSDPNVLPPPVSGSLEDRLARIDSILNREPEQSERGRARLGSGNVRPGGTTPDGTLPQAPQDMATGPLGTPNSVITRDPEAILRSARRRAAEQIAGDTNARPKTVAARVPKKPSTDGHQLRPSTDGITIRQAPSSRFLDRLSKISRKPYPKEDVHGLPVAQKSADGTTPPRQGIKVEQVPDKWQEKADDRIYKLARFFRGNQEEVTGMQPPERKAVDAEPLARIVDNLVPENDPARGRVVDESALDLTGVERASPDLRQERPVTRTPSGPLDQNFIDRLTTVLQPRDQPPPTKTEGAPPGQIGLNELDLQPGQLVPIPKPDLPDPWTMTVEKTDQSGDSKTLGVTAISPEDGSVITGEDGVVNQMVGRIRELLVGPRESAEDGPSINNLDENERQSTAEKLLSEALRDGTPAALPDAGAWQVTEVEARNAPPGVPPKSRPGALTRTSLENVILSLGESVTLENTLPPQQGGLDPLNECIKKNRGTTLFCVEPIDWPQDLRASFLIPTILYTGPMAITRYDQGLPSRFHALFDSKEFEKIVAYYQSRYGEPTEIWKRSIAPLAKPRTDNPTVTWRSRDASSNVISVLEIRKFDDTRGGFPDTNRGAVMLYQMNAPSIFPQVSSHELMRLRRAR